MMRLPFAFLTIALCVTLLAPQWVHGQENDEADKTKAQAEDAAPDGAGETEADPENKDQPETDQPETDQPETDQPETDAPSSSERPQAAAWDKALADWKTLLSQLRELREKYVNAENDELPAIRKEYDELRAKGATQLVSLKETARKAFVEAPNEDRELLRFLLQVCADHIRRDQYDQAYQSAKFLIDNKSEDKQVYNLMGLAAYGSNRFADAKKYLDLGDEAGVLNNDGQAAHRFIDEVAQAWEEEAKLLEAEAKADDLPRAKIKTSQGDIVVELFENEAPETVGNFISLIEKGFYDKREFFRVIPGFMAQVGSPNDDGTGGPGYNVYCECYKEPHRNHFAGYLSMAHAGRDTGGSQFYLTFKPTPHLNGKHTVFGRVIDGMDVLSKIQRFEPAKHKTGAPKPKFDMIEEIEILRKRPDSEYKPNKVKTG